MEVIFPSFLSSLCIKSYQNSAFVGLGTLIILLPLPGYLASKMQVINTKKMEKVS